MEVETPRDREGTFSPEAIQKRQTILAEGLSDKIISLYATGQSMRDISGFLAGRQSDIVVQGKIEKVAE